MKKTSKRIEFGQFLRATRLRKRLTLGEIAKEMGCHSQFIHNLESAICKIPPKSLTKAAKIYGIPVEEFRSLVYAVAEEELRMRYGVK